jgi:WD40 repeat protein
MGVAAAEQDLARAATPEAERLRRRLAQNAHVLGHDDDIDVLLPTLLARLHDYPQVAGSLREMLQSFEDAWLECLWAPPDLAHPAVVRTMRFTTERVVAMAMAPDGTWIAAANWDGTASIWNLDGTVRATLSGHDEAVTAVAIAPDGTWLATASWDETVRTWLADGTPLAVLEGSLASVEQVAIAPDGTWLAAVTADGSLLAWGDHGGPLWRVQAQASGFDPVVIGSDSSWLAHLSEDDDVCVWNRDGTLRATIPKQEGLQVLTLAAHPRRDLIVAAHEDSRVRLWSPEGVLHGVVETVLDIYSAFALSPDGSWLAGKVTSPDGIIAARLDQSSETRFVRHPSLLNGLAISSDNTRLVTAREPDTIQIWDLDGLPRREENLHRTLLNAVTTAPDGTWLATAGNGLTLRGTEDGSTKTLSEEVWFTSVAISPSGRWLAGGDSDGLVRLFDRDGTPIRTLRVGDGRTETVAISPDGTWLAAGGKGSRVRLWRADGTPLTSMRSPSKSVDYIAIAPDGTWLATAGYTQVQLWDSKGRRLASTLDSGKLIGGLAMARNSDWVAAALWDGSIMLWDRTGGHVKTLPATGARYTGLAVSPHSEYLAASAYDGTLHVWDVNAEQRITMIRMDDELNGCAWAPDGGILYAAGDAGLYGFMLQVSR